MNSLGDGSGTPRTSVGQRIFDLTVSIPAILLLAPVFLVVSILVLFSLGRPILFRQERPGLGCRPIQLLKFRTMTNERDEEGRLLPDGDRLTRVGKFLRAFSLDELPELFNVLEGDMSVVGPRPLLMRYLPYFSEREQLRHTVKPGITGWAQVNGRNDASWDERLEMDVWYAEHRSPLLDLKILGRTFLVLLGKKGVVVDPRSVMLNLDEERSARESRPMRGLE